MDAAFEQGFTGIYITYADDAAAVHDERLDGLRPVPGTRIQVCASECRPQGFRTQMAQQVVFQRVPAGPVDGTETAGVAKAQAGIIAEQNINVVMLVCRDRRIQDAEAAGHAQVQDARNRVPGKK